MRKLTRREEAAEDYAVLVGTFDAEMAHAAAKQGWIPDEWRAVWQSRETGKSQISLRVDDDILKFFRSLGPGYGSKMNRVLRAFVLARMGGFIQGGAIPKEWQVDWTKGGPGGAPGPDEMVVPRALVRDTAAFMDAVLGELE